MDGGACKYTCRTASETLEWINAIINFLKPYRFFVEAHVVNFFKDRLWGAVDKEWMDCLGNECVENLLLIPSGVVQDHWPASLKKFIHTLRSLALPREQADLQKVLPDLQITSLHSMLTQGMNQKKKHEVQALAAVVNSIARNVGANTVLDVGAGQGYLAQVLSFQYQLAVIAIDASSNHGKITDARALRIKKHYAAKMREFGSDDRGLCMPKTVTCHVLSADTLKALRNSLLQREHVDKLNLIRQSVGNHSHETFCERKEQSSSNVHKKASFLLAGLHACGDLSVTMLRTFLECQDVKAVVSIGCCYNLVSEEVVSSDSQCGFPMSKGVKSAGLSLGKNSCDLACQSADRWKVLGKDAGLHNFELHAFRAAFQMVLFRYYPESLVTSPVIGRQGKALRRQQHQRMRESTLCHKDTAGSVSDTYTLFHGLSINQSAKSDETKFVHKCSFFVNFCQSGLCRLGLSHLHDVDFAGLWKETEPYAGLIGPYWSLRAALGPVLETILLLDRLLFLQEQDNFLEAVMLPIFDPTVSPRNVAIIGKKI